jgi:NADH-quinone oxidoreductase subunit N
MAALLGAVYTGKDRLTPMLTWGTAALFLALALWIGTTTGERTAFGGCSSTMPLPALPRW